MRTRHARPDTTDDPNCVTNCATSVTKRRVPTHLQVRAIEAYVRCGSYKAAAHDLGLSESTVRRRVTDARNRTGVLTNEQLTYRGAIQGWLVLPEAPAGPDDAVAALTKALLAALDRQAAARN